MTKKLAKTILAHCQSHLGAMVDLLGKLVAVDSGPDAPDGVNEVGSLVSSRLSDLGFEMDSVKAGEYGRLVIGTKKGNSDRQLLLLGHMDTVFPRGTSAARPFVTDGGRAFGPGACDAKGGLVTSIYALKALAEVGWAEAPVAVLLNSHEEVGSALARRAIEAEAAKSYMTFNLEAARADGAVVTARKGVAFLKVECEGRSAHAGAEPEKGINAVEAISHKVLALQGLSNPSKGITVNVDMVHGGTAVNVIPDRAEARVDLRYASKEDLGPILEQIERVVEAPSVPGARCSMNWDLLFVPMERTPQVEETYRLVKRAADLIGMQVGETFTGGGSDAGFVSATGARVICGMGPVGGGAHGPGEYVELRSLPERAALLAISLVLGARE